MQHQYWVTKKSVSRKLGAKEDACIVSSDAELDAKLELFKSVAESCLQLQRVVDLYQERLCCLAQDENALGRYLKEFSKNERNAAAAHIMATGGKALAYVGHQRLAVRAPLLRLHHEVDTFRHRAVSDSRATVSEMEKARTEYRAALSWMKAASGQLDPESGLALERFRKAQAYVKSTKVKFDRLTLACLQKVDLLAAARCNMFSHALVPYQSAICTFATRAAETLTLAADKLGNDNAQCDLSALSDLDKDKSTFFSADYTDKEEHCNGDASKDHPPLDASSSNMLDLDTPSEASADVETAPLLEINDDSGSDFMPSNLIQQGFDFDLDQLVKDRAESGEKKEEKSAAQMTWLSMFAELDPLANQDAGNSADRV